ncbi:MAG: putative GTP-binding protein [Deltaproteobacteria bacterium]|nr:putative GTP-binding protein [Deltaproteobacteria bacterium]
MSEPRPVDSVKLLMSTIFTDGDLLKSILEVLSEHYGGIDFISAQMPFHYTDYYTEEMGSPLARRFIFFDVLIPPESLPDVKLLANDVEHRFSVRGKRRVNIDPGYISQAHLILATGKGYTHRPYLRDGIYADLTLMYRGKTFHSLPWTYPDYSAKQVIDMFNRIRSKYIMQLKH